MRARDRAGLSRIFRHYGEVEAPRLGSAVYTELSLAVAEDRGLLSLAADVRAGEPPPNVLFAAVQYLLLCDREAGAPRHELAAFYPAVSGESIPRRPAAEVFRRFCLEQADRLRPLLREGRTQTCVVHRCTCVLPALACLRAIEARGGRVALLEVGPSAGLNLRLDRYRYDYGDGHVWGAEDALPLLVCDRRGGRRPPLPGRIEVVARRGLDLHRVDPSDEATARWLRALIWPEHFERAEAMGQALAHVAAVPIDLVEGDATTMLADEIGRLPADAARVVFATQVLYQIPPEGRARVFEQAALASRQRPLDFVLFEATGEGDSALETLRFEDGAQADRRLLARGDSHGRWLDWRAASP